MRLNRSCFGGFFVGLKAPWFLAITVAFIVAILAVWWGGVNQDEGWYLYAAQLVREGKMPYRDFFFTQGPVMPFFYAPLVVIWGAASPLHGLLGGRLVTLAFSVCGVAVAMALVRRLVARACRPAATLATFALLAGNLYHVYFTTIPKTYALGGFLALLGFLLLSIGLGVGAEGAGTVRSRRCGRALAIVAGGFAFALASGTRISLILILPVVGFYLLFRFRAFAWAFLYFGLGGALGLMLVYGFFALDAASLQGLLAAQAYHAARGGFDPFFAVGSLSRLTRGYVALGAVLFASVCLRPSSINAEERVAGQRDLLGMLLLSFAAVFVLQLSAPFPYDDYQVPLMGLLTTVIVAGFFKGAGVPLRRAWFVVLAVGMAAVSSPLLQSWAVYGQDRFWSLKKECTDLAKLRAVAQEINRLDPGGKQLLTQDLYLAVEAGRKVPEGLEMGPFSYFPGLTDTEARKQHVHNTSTLEQLILSAPAPVAAFSGYAFAVAAPRCDEAANELQARLHAAVKKHYDLVRREERFGQNATPLLLWQRKGKGK